MFASWDPVVGLVVDVRCGWQRVGVVLNGFVMSWVGAVRNSFVDPVDDGLVDVVFTVFGEEPVAFGGGVEGDTDLGVCEVARGDELSEGA